MTEKNTFKEKIKKLRQEKNLSQKDLATQLNVTQTTVSKWENGDREPSYETLSKIAKHFQVSVDYLIADADEFKFDLQLLGNSKKQEIYIAHSIGALLSLKDERSKKLTLQIVEDVIQLSIPQLEALSALIKTIK